MYIYINFKTKYIINYFRDEFNFLLSCTIYYTKIKLFTSGIATIILNQLDDTGLLSIIYLIITYYER